MPMSIGYGMGLGQQQLLKGLPITASFVAAAVVPAIVGPKDLTTNAARAYLQASESMWSGRIKGTSASLYGGDDSGYNLQSFTVSVDGGAPVNIDRIAGKTLLFSGLSDAWHTVNFIGGPPYGAANYVLNTGTVLDVFGLSPAIECGTSYAQAGLTGDFTAASLIANAARFIPTQKIDTSKFDTASLGMTGIFAALYFSTKSAYVFVSVDGAAPTIIPTVSNYAKFTCPIGSHSYYCADAGGSTTFGVGVIGVKAGLSVQKRLCHWGDSITAGVSATSRGHTDMGRTAPRSGYLWNNLGVGGATIASTKAAIDTDLADLTASGADIAVVSLGRNESFSAMTAQNKIDYNYIIDAIKTKGFGKVICLAVLNTGTDFSGYNTDLSTMVSARTDTIATYLNRATYTGITTSDGTHPTDAGYIQIDAYNQTYLDPLLLFYTISNGAGVTGTTTLTGPVSGNYTVTSTVVAGGPWTVTTAQLASGNYINLAAPASSLVGAVFSVPDCGLWLIPATFSPQNLTAAWYLDGVYQKSGLSWDSTGSTITGLEVKAVITPEAGTAINVIAQAAAAYVQNFVDPQGTTYITTGYNSSPVSKSKHYLSWWQNRSTIPGYENFCSNDGLSVVFSNSAGGLMNLKLTDNAGTTIYEGNYAFGIGLKHYYIAVDLTVPSVSFRINDVNVTAASVVTALIAGTGLLKPNSNFKLLGISNVNRVTGKLTDLVFQEGTIVPASTLYNAGSPPLLDSILINPDVYLGGKMKAGARNGDTTKGWNAGYNQGTALGIITGSTLNLVDA